MKLIEDPFRFVTLSRWQNKTSKVYVANAAVLVMAALPYFVSFRFWLPSWSVQSIDRLASLHLPNDDGSLKPKQSTLQTRIVQQQEQEKTSKWASSLVRLQTWEERQQHEQRELLLLLLSTTTLSIQTNLRYGRGIELGTDVKKKKGILVGSIVYHLKREKDKTTVVQSNKERDFHLTCS